MTDASLARRFAPPPSPLDIMRASGLEPDEWQARLLTERPSRALVRCARQVGKSTVAAAMSLDQALTVEKSLTLLVSPSQRQSSEVFGRVRELLTPLASQPQVASTRPVSESILSLRLQNGSRILSLPSSETTIRGYSPHLVILDEAGFVTDSLVHAVLPMLGATGGRLIGLSTPNGMRGWFWLTWSSTEPYMKIKVTASECGRITPERIEEARRTMPALRFAAEYEVTFGAAEGAVFPPELVDAILDPEVTPL